MITQAFLIGLSDFGIGSESEMLSHVFQLCLFSIEVILRLIALGKMFSYQWWNIFDATLVALSIVIHVTVNYTRIIQSPNKVSLWLPILKLVRIVRILQTS